ncbi:MAG: hypothetical protein AAB932_04905 [Patescibacteria group bacterium]
MKEKILITVFLLLVVIPELIWSPLPTVLMNFFNSDYFFRPTNFLNFSQNVMSSIFFIETVGCVGITVLLLRLALRSYGSKKVLYIGLCIGALVLSILSIFVLWLSFALRSIGF